MLPLIADSNPLVARRVQLREAERQVDVSGAAPRESDAGAAVAVVVEDRSAVSPVLGFDADRATGGARADAVSPDSDLGETGVDGRCRAEDGFCRGRVGVQVAAVVDRRAGDLPTGLGEDHIDTLLTRDQLIGAIIAQGRFAETEPMYRELISEMTRVLGADHRDTLTTSVDLAWSIGMQGRPAEAAEICRRTLDLDRRILGEENPRNLDAWTTCPDGPTNRAITPLPSRCAVNS